MTIKPVVPHFDTETEEAEWWCEHREEHDERLADAVENGTTLKLRDALWEQGLVLQGLKEVAIPLEEDDLERARQQAAGRGLDYHQYLSKLLHEALSSRDAA